MLRWKQPCNSVLCGGILCYSGMGSYHRWAAGGYLHCTLTHMFPGFGSVDFRKFYNRFVSLVVVPSANPVAAPGSSPNSSLSAGQIAGVVIGGVMGIIIIAALVFFFWRRQQAAPMKTQEVLINAWLLGGVEMGRVKFICIQSRPRLDVCLRLINLYSCELRYS